MPFFPQVSRFMTFLFGHVQKSKFGELRFETFRVSYFFLAFPFSPFLIFLLHWLIPFWDCFQLKILWESVIEMDDLYQGLAKCRCRNFYREFFTQISKRFRAHFRLPALGWSLWSGYPWKDIFFFQDLSINDANLVKGNDVRSRTKANARHRRLRATRKLIVC